ncbi:MAG: hypothetical protein QXN62_08830 [Candidatus Bathyarchaeia archaeon]
MWRVNESYDKAARAEGWRGWLGTVRVMRGIVFLSHLNGAILGDTNVEATSILLIAYMRTP